MRLRFASGQRTELHDDGIVGSIPIPDATAEWVIHVEPITTSLRAGEWVDFLLYTDIGEPEMGPVLPPSWRLCLDLSGGDAARLACKIVNPQWTVSALPFRHAYAPLLAGAHLLVASDIGRFVVRINVDRGERQLSGSDV